MSVERPERLNRREVLLRGARYVTLGGLAILGGHLFLQSKVCINNSICDQCGIFKGGCELPPAVLKREDDNIAKMDNPRAGDRESTSPSSSPSESTITPPP